MGDDPGKANIMLPVVVFIVMMMTVAAHQQVLTPGSAVMGRRSLQATEQEENIFMRPRPVKAVRKRNTTLFNQCLWLESSGIAGCVSRIKIPLAVDSDMKPLDVYQQYMLFSLDRQSLCDTAKDKAACSKLSAQRCFWSDDSEDPTGGSACLSMDFADELWFTLVNFTISSLGDIPAHFTCPGSRMRWFMGCYQIPQFAGDDACKAVKGCIPYGAPSKRRCYPSWFIEEMNEQQTNDFIDGMLYLDPAYIGNCSSACWLRQAQACNTIGTTKATCERQEYCLWNDGVCSRSVGSVPGSEDPFSKAVTALRKQCWELDDKGKEACNSKMAEAQQGGNWLNWVGPAERVKCSITSLAQPSTPDRKQLP